MKLKVIATIFVILIVSSYFIFLSGEKNQNYSVDNTAKNINKKNKSKQDSILSINALNDYLKIYGLLKYYHPLYSSGEVDINDEFKKNLFPKDSVISKFIFNRVVDSLLSDEKINEKIIDIKLLQRNANDSFFNWIKNSIILNYKNKKKLIFITQYVNQRDKLKYVKNCKGNKLNAIFINEDVLNDTIFPNYKNRILALAKYWNMVNYFYPYKSEINNFDNLLFKYLNKIKDCKSAVEYHLTMLELTAEINDGHVNTKSKIISNYFGKKYLPFKVEYLDSNFYISKVSNRKYGFKKGDKLIKVNGIDIKKLADNIKKYISSNNKGYIYKKICSYIVKTHQDSLCIKIKRDNKCVLVNTKTINYQKYYQKLIYGKHTQVIKQSKKIYLNLRLVRKIEIDYAFNNYDTIILDLRDNIRTGLRFDIDDRLFSKPIKWGLFKMPDLNRPGYFNYSSDFLCGKKNSKPFTGCLYVIINENTKSQGEASCMMFSFYKNSILIGRNTCGANGNVSSIKLPGKIQTRFSGVGVLGLNGEKYQNIGIKPNIYIKRTKKNIINNEDEILEYLHINYK